MLSDADRAKIQRTADLMLAQSKVIAEARRLAKALPMHPDTKRLRDAVSHYDHLLDRKEPK